jgi:hypothetical protein
MNPLARLQDDFQAFMLRSDTAIESHVIGTQRVPIATRLAIYGDGYASRLIEALEANYPALAKLLGPADFPTLGTAYVRAHDSRFRSVRYYGAELADFLASRAEYLRIPVLTELARWEWAMTEAFDAADAAPITSGALTHVAAERWADLSFEFHPSLRRLGLFWNVPQTWKALTDDAGRPEQIVQAIPVQWLIWRQDLQTFFRSLQASEAEALDIAHDGATFGELCAALAQHFTEDETPARAAGYLRRWVNSGLITRVK